MERKASKEDNTALSLSVRAQKKILGSVAGNTSLAKLFIDDRSAQLLDTLYRLTRDYTDNKRRAEKLLKYSIKSAIKFMVLLRKDQLNDEQLAHCAEFRRKMRHATVTLISFYEVEYSLDRTYLSGLLAECGDLMKKILEVKLTGKSIGRIEDIFRFYADEDFIQWLFTDSRASGDLKTAVADLHLLLAENVL